MPYREAPGVVIKRLPLYLRTLDKLEQRKKEKVTSQELSGETGFSAEQVRKDLACFGAFGTRGYGYEISSLKEIIIRIIGLHQRIRVFLIGAGQLGTALAKHVITKNSYVSLAGIFDISSNVVGKEIMGQQIRHISELPHLMLWHEVKVAMVTVPSSEAQEVVEFLAGNGITAILNFAPVSLKVPRGVYLQNIDVALELQSLIYYIFPEERRKYQEVLCSRV